jgi:dTDP-4-dehydrorhamnose reductase
MLGQLLFKVAGQLPDVDVYGTVRQLDKRVLSFLDAEEGQIFECDFERDFDRSLFCLPDVVINCAGIIKQLGGSQPVSNYIRVNSLAPNFWSGG